MAPAPPPAGSVRQRVVAAASRARALKRIDRGAAVLITAGGIGIVASVIGILLFVLAESWPLFLGARGRPLDTLELAAVPAPAATPAPALPAEPPATAQAPGPVVATAP